VYVYTVQNSRYSVHSCESASARCVDESALLASRVEPNVFHLRDPHAPPDEGTHARARGGRAATATPAEPTDLYLPPAPSLHTAAAPAARFYSMAIVRSDGFIGTGGENPVLPR
jgi:hypothetical protein